MKPLTTAESELFVNFNFHSNVLNDMRLNSLSYTILLCIFLNVCYIIYNIIHSVCIFVLNNVHDKHKINTNNSDFTVFYIVCFLSACLGLPIT